MALADSFAEVEIFIERELIGLKGQVHCYHVTGPELLRLNKVNPDIPSELIGPEMMSALSSLPYLRRRAHSRGVLKKEGGLKSVVAPSLDSEGEYPQFVITSLDRYYDVPEHAEEYTRRKLGQLEKALAERGFASYHRIMTAAVAETQLILPVLAFEYVTGMPEKDLIGFLNPPGINGSGLVTLMYASKKMGTEAREAWQEPSIPALGGRSLSVLQRNFSEYYKCIPLFLNAVAMGGQEQPSLRTRDNSSFAQMPYAQM